MYHVFTIEVTFSWVSFTFNGVIKTFFYAGETILKRGRKKQPTTSTAVVRSSRDDIAQLPPPLVRMNF